MKLIAPIAIAATLVFALLASAAHASTSTLRPATEKQVIVLINKVRVDHGLHRLTLDTKLRNAARYHSRDEMTNDYFSHDGPSGTFGVRIDRYVHRALAAENICYGTGGWSKASGIVSLWMHSPEHRQIILTPSLRRVGVGVAFGTFKGQPGTGMATADFST
jgi:uncharacterized protein YkwD